MQTTVAVHFEHVIIFNVTHFYSNLFVRHCQSASRITRRFIIVIKESYFLMYIVLNWRVWISICFSYGSRIYIYDLWIQKTIARCNYDSTVYIKWIKAFFNWLWWIESATILLRDTEEIDFPLWKHPHTYVAREVIKLPSFVGIWDTVDSRR